MLYTNLHDSQLEKAQERRDLSCCERRDEITRVALFFDINNFVRTQARTFWRN